MDGVQGTGLVYKISLPRNAHPNKNVEHESPNLTEHMVFVYMREGDRLGTWAETTTEYQG